MKKFAKFVAWIMAFAFIIGVASEYNSRPLPFESQKSANPLEDFVNEKTSQIRDATKDIKLPETSKVWEDTKKGAEKFINENLTAPSSPSSKKSEPQTAGKYDRDKYFGAGWKDPDKNGCDARNDVLARDLVDVTKSGDCIVLTGTLEDKYSGQTIEHVRGKSKLDIDHRIPLSLAYNKGGADKWTQSKRIAFANDPINLSASSASENRSKGDSSPSEWMPSNKAFHCEYSQGIEKVVKKYDVIISKADQKALDNACK